MKIWLKISICTALSLMFCFMTFGYAALTTTLTIQGNASAEEMQYEEMVITNVTVCSGTTATQSATVVRPANVKSTVTGGGGQTVVYKITAHNYSQTETYVYSGAFYSEEYAAIADTLTISASNDEYNSDIIPASYSSNYYEGTPVAPGEEIVFYVTYALNESVSGDVMINFKFVPVAYTVTYLVDNELYAVDCIVDNTVAYTVRQDTPAKDGMVFANWVNANAQAVSSYPAGNTNSYTLSATWENTYLIIFVDKDGNVLYQEIFTDSSTALSAEGQSIVDAKLAELAAVAAENEMTVSWSDYDIASATSDITVRPLYTYHGNLLYTPVDEDGDGITDYYQLDAVGTLDETVRILGEFNGLEVKVVNKLYANDNNFDYSSGVKTIIIGEGVQILKHNSLAYTANLSTVYLPSTITSMEKNVFSRNYSDDKKVLTINYNGTMAEWKALLSNSNSEWHNGLLTGSKVVCSDGYFELSVSGFIFTRYTWSEHPN